MKPSTIVKRSIIVNGHKTSVSLEQPFWDAFKDLAQQRSMTLSQLATALDSARENSSNLSSAIRLFVFGEHRQHKNQNHAA